MGLPSGSTTEREERRPLLLPGDVRALPREDQLIFMSGLKPIRAKKIRFDREPIFANRLRASARERVTLTTTHDWIDVKPLGFLAKDPARKSAGAHQGDLFAATGGPRVSDIALAGFRNPDGSRMSPQAPAEASPRPITKGI